jgi:splicing factor 3B subunit 3
LDHIAEFFVGDTLTSITKTSLLPGGREVLVYTTLHGSIGMFVPFVSKDEIEIFKTIEMHLRNEIPNPCGRDHVQYRSYYFPVKNVIDGDLCEHYNMLPNEKKRQIADSLDRTVSEISKKLEDIRNRVAF